MNKFINPDKKNWPELLKRPIFNSTEFEPKVKAILDAVQNDGDKALRGFAQEFDGFTLDNFQVSEAEFNEALETIDADLKTAIKAVTSVCKSSDDVFCVLRTQPKRFTHKNVALIH